MHTQGEKKWSNHHV